MIKIFHIDVVLEIIITSLANEVMFTSLAKEVMFTSLAKGVMFLVALVCLFVSLFVGGQHYSKSYERIRMKFYGGILGGTVKN